MDSPAYLFHLDGMEAQPSYPSYDEIRRARIAARRRDAIAAVRRAEEKVRGAGGRLLVFGSLATGTFDEGSDVDIALFGLPSDGEELVAGAVDAIVREAGFDVDLVYGRALSGSLKERVLQDGREASALD